MRHLLSPLDFSVKELDELFDTASDIAANPKKYSKVCEGKNSLHCFMNQAQEQGSALKQQCLILVVLFSVFGSFFKLRFQR